MEVLALAGAATALGYAVSQSSDNAQAPSAAEAQQLTLQVAPLQWGAPGTQDVRFDLDQTWAEDPRAPDGRPTVIPHYNMPDTDETQQHNYPGHGPGPDDTDPWATRGYGDIPGGSFGPGDVTNTLEPHGLFPMIGRHRFDVLTIDPLEPKYFKPPKPTVLWSDLHEDPQKETFNVYGQQSIVGMQREYIDPYTKFHSGRGALNNLWPHEAYGSGTKPDYGFAQGEKFTFRTGGFHPRQRFFRMPERTDRKQLYFSIRNPDRAVGRTGMLYAQERPVLGHLNLPEDKIVTSEWHREPIPNAGLTANRKRADPNVVLPHTNRTENIYGWAGPKGTGDRAQENLRLFAGVGGRDVIPNKTTQFNMGMYSNPKAVVSMQGGQTTNPVVLRPTNRECYTTWQGRHNNPAPNFPKGDAGIYNTEFIVDTSMKSITDGPGVMRPGGGRIASDAVADVRCAERINPVVPRKTQKEETIYFNVIRPMNSTRTTAAQYTEWPAPRDHKVSPLIERDVDPSLLAPILQNPYNNRWIVSHQ